MYYLQSRYYDPVTGRFLNADNIVTTEQSLVGTNVFAYCYNNSIMLIDPNGNCPYDGSIEDFRRLEHGLPARNCVCKKDTILQSISNRKPGKNPPSSWPDLPRSIGGKKPKWNSNGYWEGKEGRLTWDNRSHGSGVDRGKGPQDGHWDSENSNRRWDRSGNALITPNSEAFSMMLPQIETAVMMETAVMVGCFAIGIIYLFFTGDPSAVQQTVAR